MSAEEWHFKRAFDRNSRSFQAQWKGVGSVTFRCTLKQRERLQDEALEQGYPSLSHYIRARLLDDPEPEAIEADDQTIDRLEELRQQAATTHDTITEQENNE